MLDLSRLLRSRRASGAGGALKGMLRGGALLLVAVGLQVWNEGRTFRRDALLSDAAAQVLTLPTPAVVPENDGRLVHLVGDARAARPVVDASFGIEVDGLALRRRVEMFQWREKKTERESNGRKTVSYSYRQEWSDDAIDSDRFDERSAHANPDHMPFDSATIPSEEVRVGEFVLAPDTVGGIGGWKSLDPASLALPPNMAVSFRPDGEWLSTSESPDAPAIGDVRVRFDVLPAGEISILARQQQDSLVAYESSAGDALLIAQRGKAGAREMIASEASSNSRAAWAIRFAGFMLAWIGFGQLFRPLTLLADVVPVFGRIAGAGAAIVAALLALGVSALSIGGGWIWQRPWLLVLIVVAVVVASVLMLRRRSANPASPAALGVPPPPPPSAPPSAP